MSILIDADTRVLVQGATGAQARFDIRYCLEYGTRIVAGVTPGRGGESVEGVPVFNTVAAAVAATGANASAVYVPARGVRDAVMEAVEGGIGVLACFAENVPRHDAAAAAAAARASGAFMAGFNTNGLISPGRIGVCSRSGGMSAEISWTLARAGLGASSCISMGGDPIVGMRMVEVLELFEADPETDACVIFGEPGGTHEIEVAEALRTGELRKPLVALIAGQFQENYPAGVSFGHFAAVIKGENDSASAKHPALGAAGARVAASLEEIPALLRLA